MKGTIQHPVDNRPLDATYVTMTEARRTFKVITDKAAAGEIVIITKQGTPFLQLIPLQFQIVQPGFIPQPNNPTEGQPDGER